MKHPLWLVPFHSFFILTCLAGLGFGTLLWRFAPMLPAPRLDGREH